MNISVKGSPLAAQFFSGNQMKSTQEKMQRRQNMESQVAFLQQQKENLKNKECNTLEEIADKLEMFHTYEDEIAAVKKSFNYSEMFHAMDEAEERGEQIAKAAEKVKPKTEKERKKEALEEALGTDENQGMLDELLEEMDTTEEGLEEENAGELKETLPDDLEEKLLEKQLLEKETDIQKNYVPVDFRV